MIASERPRPALIAVADREVDFRTLASSGLGRGVFMSSVISLR